ncbi:MAG: 50S ribosomal protein L25 [Anaerolineales bacterium]|jgi:large subunit ribosomal protein L25|nr:50S ribosomal protein L25 [Anaerolineales bacterium]
MEEIKINASPRKIVRKGVKALRREGQLPAVLYGRNFETQPIMFDYRETSRVIQLLGSSTLVVIDLGEESHYALIREKQRDVIKGNLLHVDFQVVSLTEKVHAEVSVELIGESPAVKDLGGLIVVNNEQLEVEALPRDLPDRIVIDISTLQEIGDTIYVRDLNLEGDVSIMADEDEPIVLITLPSVEAEPEEEEVEEEEFLDESEPEVIEKGKREDEEASEE